MVRWQAHYFSRKNEFFGSNEGGFWIPLVLLNGTEQMWKIGQNWVKLTCFYRQVMFQSWPMVSSKGQDLLPACRFELYLDGLNSYLELNLKFDWINNVLILKRGLDFFVFLLSFTILVFFPQTSVLSSYVYILSTMKSIPLFPVDPNPNNFLRKKPIQIQSQIPTAR